MAIIPFHKLLRISAKGDTFTKWPRIPCSRLIYPLYELKFVVGGGNGKVFEGLTNTQFGRAKSGSRSQHK